MFYCDFRHLLL